MFPFLIPETIDIDTKFDLALAKFLIRNKKLCIRSSKKIKKTSEICS